MTRYNTQPQLTETEKELRYKDDVAHARIVIIAGVIALGILLFSLAIQLIESGATP